MTVRWLTCIAASLTVHAAGLWYWNGQALPQSGALVPVTVQEISLASAPHEPIPSLPEIHPTDSREPQTPVSADPVDRFRPNQESGEPTQEQTRQPEDSPQHKQEDTVLEPPTTEAPSAYAALPPEKKKEAVAAYRSQLMEQFQEQWEKVPELTTIVKDVTLLPHIDSHFGIVILAYSFVDHRPGPPFLLFNMQDGSAQKLENFDFAGFSNRIKDRMLYAQYRSWLAEARRRHGINSLMKVIGLVPAEVDRYFCAKQLRAIELADVTLDQTRATNGHYEPDGTGGFNLIIDSVITTDGRTIQVHDEELRFSMVARR